MNNENLKVIKEVQGMTEKQSYTVGSHFMRYYGKTECLLCVRLDDIDVKKIFEKEYNFHRVNKDYFIDNVCLAVTYCEPRVYQRGGYCVGTRNYFAIELFYTEHNYYYNEEGNKKIFVPHIEKKMILNPTKYPTKKVGIIQINKLLNEYFGIENLMYKNKYNNLEVFKTIVRLAEKNEKYGTVHKNYLPYNVWLYECTVGQCVEALLQAEFITIKNGWIKPTQKGLKRLEAIKQGQ